MAIASLVCAVVGCSCCVTSPIAVILGLVSLSQIKDTKDQGRGLAIAGIGIGAFTVIAYLVLLVVMVVAGSFEADYGTS